MTEPVHVYHGGPIFDGHCLHEGKSLAVRGTCPLALGPLADVPDKAILVDLGGDILSTGYVDLQVNGGDGLMFNDAPNVATLRRMAEAHRRLGTAAILPTLITDGPDVTRAAIAAAQDAIAQNVPGIAGLHLEGPHLSVAKKGAHDPALIRSMTDDDLADLVAAARSLPSLMLTVAPESVTLAQVRALAGAGAVVSLGHSDASYETCLEYAAAGARCATHLFNAMSALGHREPGLAGAALADGRLSAGLIADGLHVHPASIRLSLAAKQGPGQIFLVSDSMACAGTELAAFQLNGRQILRQNGRLTLADGTLAGADLCLTHAVRTLVFQAGASLESALQTATTIPSRLAGLPEVTAALVPGQTASLIRIRADLSEAHPLM